MTPQQIAIIEETFALALKQRPDFGALFYRRLFAIQPELRPMFKADISLQAKKLIDLLAIGVASLNDLPRLSETQRDLGARHTGYGVLPEHYLYVGVALIGTFEGCLGSAFDLEAREAWTVLYTLVSKAMKGSAPNRQRTAA